MKLIKISTVLSAILLSVICSSAMYAQAVRTKATTPEKVVKYGLQVWSPANLNVTKFRNGDPITEAKTPEEWKSAGAAHKPAWCYFNNDPENGKKFGKLYNWYAITDPRGLAPAGWRVPTNADWMKLVKNLTGTDIAGNKLKSKEGWKSKSGNDMIGFSALPGGYRDQDGKFEAVGIHAQWWSNSKPVEVKKTNHIYSLAIKDKMPEVSYLQMEKNAGLSVRCIK